MLVSLILLAEQTTTPEGPPLYVQLVPFLAFGLLAYLILWKPAREQERQRKLVIAALKKNDRIVSSAGIIGIVEAIKEKEDEVILRGGLHILKSSIVRVLGPEDSGKDNKDS